MTLDLTKFISNSIKTQAKIQHLDISTKTVKSLPRSIEQLITEDYGDNYLLDADYISFFWGAIGKDEIKKLFNVVDKALGKSANKLTETDFKKISMPIQDGSPDSEEDKAPEEDASSEEVSVEEIDEEPIEDASRGIDQDGEQEELDEDEKEVDSQQKTNYFFLKITLK